VNYFRKFKSLWSLLVVVYDDVVVERLEGGRILANLEMHETDVSSNPSDETVSGLPAVGSIVTAQ